MIGGSSGDTPIFDEVARLFGVMVCTAPFRHGGGQPCHGCQSCLAEVYELTETCETEEDDGKESDTAG